MHETSSQYNLHPNSTGLRRDSEGSIVECPFPFCSLVFGGLPLASGLFTSPQYVSHPPAAVIAEDDTEVRSFLSAVAGAARIKLRGIAAGNLHLELNNTVHEMMIQNTVELNRVW